MGAVSTEKTVMWRKSSRSNEQSLGCCVELAAFGPERAIRDSKNPDGPRLRVSNAGFRTMIADIKNAARTR